LIGTALLVLLVSACGDDDDDQPAASLPPTELAGTKWVLSSYVADDEDVVSAAVSALDFGESTQRRSGPLSGRASTCFSILPEDFFWPCF
jgi:hypothetical protein